jgi:hypothetical protein
MNKINICLSILFLTSFLGCKDKKDIINLVQSPLTADTKANEVAMPRIEIENDVYDFGKIDQDKSVSKFFHLHNVGDAPLLIRSAKGSCGCTVPEWPKEAVAAGDYATIKVTFNSGKKSGKQNKTVSLVTNAIPSIKVLTIKGTVLVPKK